jgi:hypothetical protein
MSCSSLSPDMTLEEITEEAERCWVRRDCESAWRFANHVVSKSLPLTESVDTTTTTEIGKWSLSSSLSFTIRWDDTLYPVDRASAILLQCCVELSVRIPPPSWEAYYTTSPMPVELFVLFILFLKKMEKNWEAMCLTSEFLYEGSLIEDIEQFAPSCLEAMNELIWFLVTKIFPFCPDEKCLELLCMESSIFSPDQCTCYGKNQWREQASPVNVRKLLKLLESKDIAILKVASAACLETCRKELIKLCELDSNNSTSDASSLGPVNTPNLPVSKNKALEAWFRWCREFLLRLNCWKRNHITRSNFSGKYSGTMTTTSFLLVILLLSWRKRRNPLVRTLYRIVIRMLNPITELVAATLMIESSTELPGSTT